MEEPLLFRPEAEIEAEAKTETKTKNDVEDTAPVLTDRITVHQLNILLGLFVLDLLGSFVFALVYNTYVLLIGMPPCWQDFVLLFVLVLGPTALAMGFMCEFCNEVVESDGKSYIFPIPYAIVLLLVNVLGWFTSIGMFYGGFFWMVPCNSLCAYPHPP